VFFVCVCWLCLGLFVVGGGGGCGDHHPVVVVNL